jgi:hypothetical protein
VPFQKQADLAPKSRFCDALSRGQPSKGLETGLDDGKNADATIWQCQNRKVLDSLPKTYFGGSGARSEGCDEDPSINCSDDNGTRNSRHPGVYEQCVQEQPAWLVRFHHSTPNENWLSSGSTMARRVLAEGCPRRFYNLVIVSGVFCPRAMRRSGLLRMSPSCPSYFVSRSKSSDPRLSSF